MEGNEIGAANSGAMNKAKILDGFVRLGDWASEERIPTRLGDESVELALAYVVDGEIVPYSAEGSDENVRWSLSVVRMLKKNGEQRTILTDKALEAKACAIEGLPRFKYQVLCILDNENRCALLFGNSSSNQPMRIANYEYSPLTGFLKRIFDPIGIASRERLLC
jgi:hypothetical protein